MKTPLLAALLLATTTVAAPVAAQQAISASDRQQGAAAHPQLVAEFGGAYTGPQAAYVARIGSVFTDNGKGVRGDLKAVVRAILLDPEARGDEPRGGGFGKVKEPVLVMMGLVRASGLQTDGAAMTRPW